MVGGGPILSRGLGGVGGPHWDSRGLAPRWHLLKEGCVCVCALLPHLWWWGLGM